MHSETLRLWMARWPAFDWNKLLNDSARCGTTYLMRGLIQNMRAIPQQTWREPLCLAARHGQSNALDILLAEQPPVGALCDAMENAIANGRDALVQRLLTNERLVLIDRRLVAWIRTAIDYNQGAVLSRLLLRASAKWIDAWWVSLVTHATWKKHTEMAKLILADPRVDPTALDTKAICDACTNGNADLVAALLADGRADPVARGNYPITAARDCGRHVIVEMLLADPRVAAVNRDYSTLPECIVAAGGLAWMGLCVWMSS